MGLVQHQLKNCWFSPLSFTGSGMAQYMNKAVFHNREAVQQHAVWSTENLILLLILTSISTTSVNAFNTFIVIQSWRVLFITWIYPLTVVGGREVARGSVLMSASRFSLPQYICISFHFVYTCFFYLCLLCCVVLYKWLEADLHGKSSDTADKTSGKEALRTKQSPGPFSLFIFCLPTPLESN